MRDIVVPLQTDGEHSREHVIRRLEAFSDVVIGFSLAQLGLSLVLPQHAIDFVQRPVGTVAFIVTFTVVVRFWWTHFTIFRHYFEPNRLMITCNFIALAGLIVQVFSLQLYLHFVPKNEGMAAARIYFGLFSFAYGMLGLMFGLGLRYRWRFLTMRQRRTGLRETLRILGAVLGCTLGNISSSHTAITFTVGLGSHSERVATAPATIFLYTFVGWLAAMVAGQLAPRFFPTLQQAGSRAPVDTT